MKPPLSGLVDRSLARIVIAAFLCNGAFIAEAESAPGQPVTSLSLAMRASIEQCKSDLSVPDLDSIRQKADPSRIAGDGPPPYSIASNDTFATETDRQVIAKWITIRNLCLKRFDALLVVPQSATATEAAALRQAFALTLASESSLGDLIQALLDQKLTYGEFARKRFEFTRDAAALNAKINEAGLAQQGDSGLVASEHRLSTTIAGWRTYVSAVKARRPRSVHVADGRS
jgi:hypothetical protein